MLRSRIAQYHTPPARQEPQQPLLLSGLAGLATLLLTLVPGLSLLGYPFRLLVTMVHELSHGLAAILTGGSFLNFVVFPNGAGLAYTAGGWRLLIIPAGYLGAALFGAAMILLSRRYQASRRALLALGALILLLTLRYGLPSLFSRHWLSALLTVGSGLLFGGFFLWVALRASPSLMLFFLNLVALQAALRSFGDVVGLIGLSTNLLYAPGNDAQSMAAVTHIPAVVWALAWAMITLLLIGAAIWSTWLRPHLALRRR